jgi:hypothetical protein
VVHAVDRAALQAIDLASTFFMRGEPTLAPDG